MIVSNNALIEESGNGRNATHDVMELSLVTQKQKTRKNLIQIFSETINNFFNNIAH